VLSLDTFSAYLGAVMPAHLGGCVGAITLLLAIFAPAFFLVGGSAFGLLVYGPVSPVFVVAGAAAAGWALGRGAISIATPLRYPGARL